MRLFRETADPFVLLNNGSACHCALVVFVCVCVCVCVCVPMSVCALCVYVRL